MEEIDEYLKEKENRIKLEKQLAWREFYLQDEITWDELQIARQQRIDGIEDKIELPIFNMDAAIKINYKIQRLIK